MKDSEVFPPVVIDHAKGLYLYGTDGKAYLDIISSWWCNLLGHCNPEINEAVKEQLDQVEHVIFTNFSHRPAIKLCRELAPLLPKGLTKFTFHDNGSSAVEAALKMAFQYHYQTGHPERQKFMCLAESYHGETIGALSVGSMDMYAKIYKPMMMEISISAGSTVSAVPTGRRGRPAAANASRARKRLLKIREGDGRGHRGACPSGRGRHAHLSGGVPHEAPETLR